MCIPWVRSKPGSAPLAVKHNSLADRWFDRSAIREPPNHRTTERSYSFGGDSQPDAADELVIAGQDIYGP
jgi:hypothetical protein